MESVIAEYFTVLTRLHWERPGFLWIIGLLPLLLAFFSSRYCSKKALQYRFKGIIEPHLLPYMLTPPRKRKSTSFIAFLAWFAALLAAATPVIDNHLPSIKHDIPPSRDIIVVLDISNSMLTQDVLPNRLTRAKKELQELLAQIPNDRLALITYAANAYLVLPFTHDHTAFLHFVEHLSPELVQNQGSNLTQALELAMSVFKKDGQTHPLFLLSDGEAQATDADLLNLAQRLNNHKIRLFSLGIGTPEGHPVLDSHGQLILSNGLPVLSSLNQPLLQTLSQQTQGHYSALTANADDGTSLVGALPKAIKKQRPTPHDAVHSFPLYFVFLGLSLMLFMGLAWQERPLIPVIVLAFLICPVPPLQAGMLDAYYEHKGQQALHRHEAKKAQQYFEKSASYAGKMGLGVSRYRQQHWQQAQQAFNAALKKSQRPHDTAMTLYNLGNVQAQLAHYPASVRYYRETLRLQPGHNQAALNLKTVMKRLQLKAKKESSPAVNTPSTGDRTSVDSGNDWQDPAIITLMPFGKTATDNASLSTLPMPSLNDDTPTLLRYRFKHQDGARPATSTGNPW